MDRDRGLQPPLAKQILLNVMLDDLNQSSFDHFNDLATWDANDNPTVWAACLGQGKAWEDRRKCVGLGLPFPSVFCQRTTTAIPRRSRSSYLPRCDHRIMCTPACRTGLSHSRRISLSRRRSGLIKFVLSKACREAGAIVRCFNLLVPRSLYIVISPDRNGVEQITSVLSAELWWCWQSVWHNR